MSDFLLEIGTEEIPARMVSSAAAELQRRMGELVARERLCNANGNGSPAAPTCESFSTPRRISVLVRGVAASQPDLSEQLLGPAAAHAYKDGQPTQAAVAFAKKAGVALDSLSKAKTAKGEYLAASVTRKGRSALELLAELVPKEIAAIYWAKNMYWRPGKPERFVRPVRWMVALLDDQVVPLEFGGISAGRVSRGHRILAAGPVTVASPTEYGSKLRAAGVLPSYSEREHQIRKALDNATRAVPGARWREDKELLDTVVNLTECPSVILGGFDREYLQLPEEVLVTVMRDHQKYFAVEDANGKLAPHFLAVLNTVTDAEGEAIVRHGNERVLRARFNDARFFWNTDQKLTLKDRVAMLRSVTFQKELGSYYDKAMRTQHLGSLISSSVIDFHPAHRQGVVFKAALMAKCDLTTELVKEFTELQGIIGGLYLVHQAERMELPESSAAAIGQAIYDHYKPTSMEDEVPRSLEGAVLSIADKADTIAGMFALGMVPSGSKDPFALRRAANGIVRILVEHKLPLSIGRTMQDALLQYMGSEAESRFTALGGENAQYEQNVGAFFRERLEFYLREARGFAYDVVNAVLAAGADNPLDALARAQALAKVRGSEDFDAISASFKRIKNILRQAEEKGIAPSAQPNEQLYGADAPAAEKELYAEGAVKAGARYQALLAEGNYDAALSCAASLRPLLDRFFDDVMVMVEDEQVRANRLALLKMLFDEFSRIADFSEVVTERK
jgi:glycyl-tRNA synthetase beta chain